MAPGHASWRWWPLGAGASTVLAAAAAAASPSGGALQAARTLQAPRPSLTKDGEFEGHEFWEEHDELLTQAWAELGPRNRELYAFGGEFERRYLRQELRDAAADARAGSEGSAWGLFEEVVPGVYASDALFTQEFLEDMLLELEHVESSGIPQRRPNGMNRHGVILDNVGLEEMLRGLVAAHVRPLAAMLFPEFVGASDADEHYAFTVRYEVSGDTELAKHADASVVTLNLCLGRPGWQGGRLRFLESNATGIYALPGGKVSGAGDVEFRPGLALLHRGQHKHQALPLSAGERTNLVVWLFAKHGVVRVAPRPPSEQLTPEQRWHWPEQTRAEL